MKCIYQFTSQNVKVSVTNSESHIKVEGCFNALFTRCNLLLWSKVW